ncbi:HXXEE domain-containing protein [Verrucomicrobia bacterium LW23]|nr:HXXEE domain-containing protein [Verrucomicrobia bacterium LW23]
MKGLLNHWVYGGFLAGFVLLALMPATCHGWSSAMILVYLHLPVYMIHQFEEHNEDRFRTFANQLLGGGREILTPLSVFVINIGGVWGGNAVSILLACFVHVGFGLIGVYTTLVNAVVHVVQGLRMRCYNPGLWTAVFLFFPLAAFSLAEVHHAPGVTLIHHAVGLGAAILMHAGIAVYALLRRKALLAPRPQAPSAPSF